MHGSIEINYIHSIKKSFSYFMKIIIFRVVKALDQSHPTNHRSVRCNRNPSFAEPRPKARSVWTLECAALIARTEVTLADLWQPNEAVGWYKSALSPASGRRDGMPCTRSSQFSLPAVGSRTKRLLSVDNKETHATYSLVFLFPNSASWSISRWVPKCYHFYHYYYYCYWYYYFHLFGLVTQILL